MSSRRNWKKSLSPQERVELKELDRRIKLQQGLAQERQNIREREKLIVLKYHRKMLQNRVSVRARRSETESRVGMRRQLEMASS
jgi:hypothetical protein